MGSVGWHVLNSSGSRKPLKTHTHTLDEAQRETERETDRERETRKVRQRQSGRRDRTHPPPLVFTFYLYYVWVLPALERREEKRREEKGRAKQRLGWVHQANHQTTTRQGRKEGRSHESCCDSKKHLQEECVRGGRMLLAKEKQ